MSRLAGRITYPGEATSNSSDPPSLNDRNPSASDSRDSRAPRGRNAPEMSWRQNNDRETEFSRPYRGNVRGRGNGVYQGAQRKFDRSDNFQRQDRCQEKPERSYKPDRRVQSDRTEKSERPRSVEQPEQPRRRTAKIEEVVGSEELLDLEDIITQICDLTVRSDRSAAQIKRNILGSTDLLETMEEDEWQKVCESMLRTALQQGEPEFISDLIVALFKNRLFSAVMSDELMAASSKHIMEEDEAPLPSLLAAILCAHWPRQYAKAFDNVNPILYTIVCIVKGWILVVREDTERYYKEEKKPKYESGIRNDEEEKDEEVDDEEKFIEEPAMVNKCAVALCDLCDFAQRQLWVNWMSVTDEIYQCIKPTITHNPNVTGATKGAFNETRANADSDVI
ncbi:unnamed protein product [Caenorhabditis sp. 36 PRJEB53466]|nr:unnamed protein product [Caenorhabditis sp. 36 PRJEB53466]